MACCTNSRWTKVISILTIILGLAFEALEAFILLCYNEPSTLKKDYIKQILLYLGLNEPQTVILLYCSIIFNSLWVIISVVLLIFVHSTETKEFSIKKTQKLINIYIIWIVFGALSLIPDVVSIFIAGIHYGKNNSLGTDGAKYMLMVTSRFVIVLVFHIVSWIMMIYITSTLQKSITEDESKPKGRIVPLKPPKPALKASKVPYLEETNVDRVRDWYKHYEGDDNKQGNSNNGEPDVVSKYIPRLNGNVNPAYVNGNHYGRPTSPLSPSPVPPSVGSGQGQAGHYMPGMHTNVMVNGVPSGTLRRQLPWSYMPNAGELPQRTPRRQAPSAPHVPAPDYDANPKKIQRQDFNQPGWKQYM